MNRKIRWSGLRFWLCVQQSLLVCGLFVGIEGSGSDSTLAHWREVADRFLRVRTTAATVLGGSELTLDGQYSWRYRDAEVFIFKIPWQIDWNETEPYKISGTPLRYSWVWEGAGGFLEGHDDLGRSWLAGNRTQFRALAISTGGGPRLWLTDWFTVLPTVDIIYGYADGEFIARNEYGRVVLERFGGSGRKWDAHLLTLSPGFEIRLRKWFGNVKLQYRSQYVFFNTLRLSRSTRASSFEGSGAQLRNEIEIEIKTPLVIRAMPIHVAGSFSRTEFFGDLSLGFMSDYYYTVGARLGPNVFGHLWRVSFIGPAGSYSWSETFDGWTVGLQVDFLF